MTYQWKSMKAKIMLIVYWDKSSTLSSPFRSRDKQLIK